MSFLSYKILIIGGTGFIGSSLCFKALEKGYKVTSISFNNPKKIIKEVEYIKADISKFSELKKKLKKNKFDYIINCGGYIDHSPFHNGGSRVILTHLGGLKNILNILDKKNIKRFIQIGSSDEYGNIKAPQKEIDNCIPVSPYSHAKLSATKMIQMLGTDNTIDACSIRLFLVYGPNQKKDRLLPYVINGLLNNGKLKLSPGKQLRDFTYIDDIVDGIFLCLESKKKLNGEIFNLCSSEPISIEDTIKKIAKIIGVDSPKLGDLKYRDKENMELWGTNDKIKDMLRWSPKIKIVDGLKKTIKSFQS